MTPLKTSLDDHFDALKDPRRDHGRVYLLKTILILAVIGVLGGANG